MPDLNVIDSMFWYCFGFRISIFGLSWCLFHIDIIPWSFALILRESSSHIKARNGLIYNEMRGNLARIKLV